MSQLKTQIEVYRIIRSCANYNPNVCTGCQFIKPSYGILPKEEITERIQCPYRDIPVRITSRRLE